MSDDTPLVLAFPGNEALAQALARGLHGATGGLDLHHFPDGETRVRIDADCAGRDVVLACTLDHPNQKLVDLYLVARTLRALGARHLLLVAPYLPYMRQDRSFHPGEGVSAKHIAAWLSGFLDGLVTAEPHLHRIHNLGEVYGIPTRVVHATAPIADWIRAHAERPLLIGPDAESRQWVEAVAERIPCPFLVLDKRRRGDREVELRLPDCSVDPSLTPVLLDDIVSSGATMLDTVALLRRRGFAAPLCVAVHALCPAELGERLRQAGARDVVSCNAVPHPSNRIDLHATLVPAVAELREQLRRG